MFWNDKRIKELEERVKALEEKGLSVQIISAADKNEAPRSYKKSRVIKESSLVEAPGIHSSENDK